MLKALIFDFDGVIVDSERSRYQELNEMLVQRGYEPLIHPLEKILGKKTHKVLQENNPRILSDDQKFIIAKIRENQRDRPIIKGIIELIELVYNRGLVIAIASGSEFATIKKILWRNNVQKYVEVITSGEDFKKSKPDPEAYIVTLKRLNIDPSYTIVIEDSQAGVDSANKAGCRVFGLETYVKLLRVERSFSSPKGIMEYFRLYLPQQ